MVTDTDNYVNDYIIIQSPHYPIEQKITFTTIEITPTPNNPYNNPSTYINLTNR